MSRLLIDDNPIMVLPQLAETIGLNEAIIIQQMHYWIKHNASVGQNFRDGRYWVYNSYPEWKSNFPWWSVDTIKRTIKSLEAKGLLYVGNYNRLGIDRTKWYSINYQRLEAITNHMMVVNE